jgi:glyoxylase-like metal-dependent hydrolase (beta-lactamase superfamily II)
MTTTPASPSSSAGLRDYEPVPKSALGPALNDHGYYVGRVERNLFWVTDGTYQSAFLATSEGVVVFDAPPSIGHNLRRAIDEMAASEGTTNKVTHLIYSHHHADHAAAASLFDDALRIGHEDTRRLLVRDNDPRRPAPMLTFNERQTLVVGGERVELEFHGPNHSPDNIFMHFPDHDALMLVDIVNNGWVPIYNLNLTEDVPGYIDAPDIALGYSWEHYIGGHLGRLGTRADLELHKRYVADIVESSKAALAAVDPTRYFVRYGPNVWAAVKYYLDEVTELAAAPVIAKYSGVLAAADVEAFTNTTTFLILQSLRLDYGAGQPVHP